MQHLAQKPILADDLVSAYEGLIKNAYIFEAEAVCSVIQSNVFSLTNEQYDQVNKAYNDAVVRSYDNTKMVAPQYNGFSDYTEMTYDDDGVVPLAHTG